MSNYVTLLGAEDVQRAGRQIEAAADTIASAASSMDQSVERMSQALNQAADRVEAAAQDARDNTPTLRDYFAAKAMQGFAADPNTSGSPDLIAMVAYQWADAMLKARSAQ